MAGSLEATLKDIDGRNRGKMVDSVLESPEIARVELRLEIAHEYDCSHVLAQNDENSHGIVLHKKVPCRSDTMKYGGNEGMIHVSLDKSAATPDMHSKKTEILYLSPVNSSSANA